MDSSICIIDDYHMNVILARMVIKQEGSFNKITSFLEAEEALDQLIANQHNVEALPDVILLDLNMPFMDGWQFLDRFQEISDLLQKQISVYILSSSIDERDIQRSKEYTCVKDFFSKPLRPAMLKEAAMSVNTKQKSQLCCKK